MTHNHFEQFNQQLTPSNNPAPVNPADNPQTPAPLNAFERAMDGKADDWTSQPAAQPLRFSFSGRGRDYLSLWLSNWILTIATLGIFSAWAKVRRLQYVHQNTLLGGSAFGFHGAPASILIGRIIAIALLIFINLSSIFENIAVLGVASASFTLILYIAYPFFIYSSMRFYSRNSSYRNVRFQFKGDLGELYVIYILGGLLTTFTFGLGYPYLAYRVRRYHVENNHWGNNKMAFNANKSMFFWIYFLHSILTLVLYAFVVGLGIAMGMDFDALRQLDIQADDAKWVALVFVVLLLMFVVLYRVATAITQDLIFKASWNSTTIGKSRFACDLNIIALYFIRFACLIASFVTLGLFTPYAQMIITKWRINSLTLTPAHDFDLTKAQLDKDNTKTAELSDMMGFDISW
jgi:uncharacterized membrane protein YjgN (DUF898 family)